MAEASGSEAFTSAYWLRDADWRIYGVGFKFDKTLDNSPLTVKAAADKIRSEGAGGRQMDGDRVTPNGDDKQWSF